MKFRKPSKRLIKKIHVMSSKIGNIFWNITPVGSHNLFMRKLSQKHIITPISEDKFFVTRAEIRQI